MIPPKSCSSAELADPQAGCTNVDIAGFSGMEEHLCSNAQELDFGGQSHAALANKMHQDARSAEGPVAQQ